MPSHWTYEAFQPEADLAQGDIISPTQELLAIPALATLADARRYMVATQSCDLVRRKKGRCDADRIGLVPVRELYKVRHYLFEKICRKHTERVYSRESLEKARQLLERICGQNEQAIGIFYLHADPDNGIPVTCLAMLRENVVVDGSHYETLMNGRVGRLTTEFQHKFGWLVGNLYSRVGTQDWSEADRSEEGKKLIRQFTDEGDDPPLWVPDSWIAAAKEAGVDLNALTPEEVFKEAANRKPPDSNVVAAGRATAIIRDMLGNFFRNSTDGSVEGLLVRFQKRLENDPAFRALLADRNLSTGD